MNGWQVGIDTGGTFTDLVAVRGRELRLVVDEEATWRYRSEARGARP